MKALKIDRPAREFGRYTTVVVGANGKRYDLGKGEHLPWHEDEEKRIMAVAAFVERVVSAKLTA